MNLEQEFWIVVLVVGILIVFTSIALQPTQEDLLVKEFPELKTTIYAKTTTSNCACYCETNDEYTEVWMNRAPEFISVGAKK